MFSEAMMPSAPRFGGGGVGGGPLPVALGNFVRFPLPVGGSGDDGVSWNNFANALPAGQIIGWVDPSHGPYMFKRPFLGRSHLDLYCGASDIVLATDDSLGDYPFAWYLFGQNNSTPIQTTVLSASVVRGSNQVQIPTLTPNAGPPFAVGSWVILQYVPGNMSVSSRVLAISGAGPFTLTLSNPIPWAIPANVNPAVCSLQTRYQYIRSFRSFGGKFATDTATLQSNPRIVEFGESVDCAMFSPEMTSDRFLVCVLGLDGGNRGFTLRNATIGALGNCQAAVNIEGGNQAISFEDVTCIGNRIDVQSSEGLLFKNVKTVPTSNGQVASLNLIGWSAGTRLDTQNISCEACEFDVVAIHELVNNVEFVGCRAAGTSAEFGVKIDDLTAVDANRPSDVRWKGGTITNGPGQQGPLAIVRVDGATFEDVNIQTNSDTSHGVDIGVGLNHHIDGVILRNIHGTGTNPNSTWGYIGEPCTIDGGTIEGSSRAIRLQHTSGLVTLHGTAVKGGGAGEAVGYLLTQEAAGRVRCDDVEFSPATAPAMGCLMQSGDVANQTAEIHNSRMLTASQSAFANNGAIDTSIRFSGHNDFTKATFLLNYYFAGRCQPSQGLITLTGATPYVIHFPDLKANDSVSLALKSKTGYLSVPTYTLGAGVVNVTAEIGDTSTYVYSIDRCGYVQS
jgi:hypothetical protein